MWNLDLKTILTGVTAAILGWIGKTLLESQRKIRFSVPKLYFGPAMTSNPFMGRNYPSEDSLGLEFEIRFFSKKTEVIGLHRFQIEFCRKTTLGAQVQFRPDMEHVIRDWDKKDSVYRLDVLELPPKKFVHFTLLTHIDRKDWPKVWASNYVRLSCETSDGKRRRFKIGHIQMPEMPPEGLRGLEYMSVNVLPLEHPAKLNQPITGFLIQAARRRKNVMMNLLDLAPEDARYWTGDAWALSKTDAKVYHEHTEARDAGEAAKIWNRVPDEWLTKEK